MFKKKDIQYSIDTLNIEKNNLVIIGWANSENPSELVKISVTDFQGNPISCRIDHMMRNDVAIARYNRIMEEPFGFKLSFQYAKKECYFLKLYNNKDSVTVKLSRQYIWLDNTLKRVASSLQSGKLYSAVSKKPMSYNQWFRETAPNSHDLAKQKMYVFQGKTPTFSIVIPLYKTPTSFLNDLILSILAQTYSRFEVCFADGSPAENKLDTCVKQMSHNDPRFHYKFIGENKGISGNTNEAVKMSSGDFIILCDHDDTLAPNALFEFAKAISNDAECDAIYSDEDKIDGSGKKHFEPHFKPDFNVDLLSSTNYICHLFGVRRTLVEKYGAFDSAYDGAQDYDFILRMTEHARKIIHVSKILYHWRTHAQSTSSNPESKMYAFDAGAHAIEAHYRRVWPNIKIDHVDNGISLGIYRTHFLFDQYPLISVIIPNMDHTEDLDKVLHSVINQTTWKNLEFIIIENNSKLTQTFEYYKKIEKEFSQVHVIKYEGDFNYSKINNFGVKQAHGNYLLFMNNDVEMIEPSSIQEMIGYCQRNDVGIVGCRLLYEDDTIQHAGVVIGVKGIAGHVFNGCPSDNATYFNRAMTAQDYSAVTAAVMLMKRDVFNQIHGFDENFAVAFNDIDLCLRTRAINKLVVYTPYACFHHYESKSRGYEDTYEKQLRFVSEIKLFLQKWKEIVLNGDPYYNPNLTVHSNDYAIRNLYVERIGGSYYGKHYIHDILTKTPEEIVVHPSKNETE